MPKWVVELVGAGVDIPVDLVEWIKGSSRLFYAWHGYQGQPDAMVKNVKAIAEKWNVPVFATEGGSCEWWDACASNNISRSYWHYSSYCTTGPAFGNRTVPNDTFGACILGWASGKNTFCENTLIT